jgi:hypothetical protein
MSCDIDGAQGMSNKFAAHGTAIAHIRTRRLDSSPRLLIKSTVP